MAAEHSADRRIPETLTDGCARPALAILHTVASTWSCVASVCTERFFGIAMTEDLITAWRLCTVAHTLISHIAAKDLALYPPSGIAGNFIPLLTRTLPDRLAGIVEDLTNAEF